MSFRRVRRRDWTRSVLGAVVVGGLATACTGPFTTSSGWHPTWGASLAIERGPTTSSWKCQYALRVSTGGTRTRLDFADTAPASATSSFHVLSVALSLPVDSRDPFVALPGSRTLLTVGGARSFSVAASHQVLTDAVPLSVHPGQDVLVDVTIDRGDRPSSLLGESPSSCTTTSGKTIERNGPVQWIDSLIVTSTAHNRVVAALGDSITEGLTLPFNTHSRWTDLLASPTTSVTNAGATGGRAAGTGSYGVLDGTRRLPSLLAQPGLTDLVIELGTNDLRDGSTAPQVLAALDQLATAGQRRGLPVTLATIAPRGGDTGWTSSMETQRSRVNAALRGAWSTSHRIRVLDVDAALRDPARTSRMLAEFDSGDHVHPGKAGQRTLAVAAARVLALPLPA